MNPEAEGIALAIAAIAFSGPASKARQNCRLCHLRVPNRCDQSPASPDALERWEGSGGCFCGASAFRDVRLCANSVLADARQTARFSRSEAFWTWRRVDRKSSGQQYIQLITSNRSTTSNSRCSWLFSRLSNSTSRCGSRCFIYLDGSELWHAGHLDVIGWGHSGHIFFPGCLTCCFGQPF